MNFPRDAWKVPHLLSTLDSHTEVPASWRSAWKKEQEAREICDKEILDDVGRLLRMRDSGAPGIWYSLTTDLFEEMTWDWPNVHNYHSNIQRFRQLRKDHQEILQCD